MVIPQMRWTWKAKNKRKIEEGENGNGEKDVSFGIDVKTCSNNEKNHNIILVKNHV